MLFLMSLCILYYYYEAVFDFMSLLCMFCVNVLHLIRKAPLWTRSTKRQNLETLRQRTRNTQTQALDWLKTLKNIKCQSKVCVWVLLGRCLSVWRYPSLDRFYGEGGYEMRMIGHDMSKSPEDIYLSYSLSKELTRYFKCSIDTHSPRLSLGYRVYIRLVTENMVFTEGHLSHF